MLFTEKNTSEFSATSLTSFFVIYVFFHEAPAEWECHWIDVYSSPSLVDPGMFLTGLKML